MGIALTTFFAFATAHTLPTPLRTLARWVQHTSRLEEPSAASAIPTIAHPDDMIPGLGGSAASPGKTRHVPSGNPVQRPLRGNWPFTVSPQKPPAGAPHRLAAPKTTGRAFIASPASTRACGLRSAEGLDSSRPKVLRRAPESGGTGRLVIAGRMADVCAELDRMAASEAALHAW